MTVYVVSGLAVPAAYCEDRVTGHHACRILCPLQVQLKHTTPTAYKNASNTRKDWWLLLKLAAKQLLKKSKQ